MSDAPTGKASRTNWTRVRQKSDPEVHRAVVTDPDIRPTDAAFWAGASVVMPRRKEPITVRLDADLLAWLRSERGYQTRINAVLRAYMVAEQRKQHSAD